MSFISELRAVLTRVLPLLKDHDTVSRLEIKLDRDEEEMRVRFSFSDGDDYEVDVELDWDDDIVDFMDDIEADIRRLATRHRKVADDLEVQVGLSRGIVARLEQLDASPLEELAGQAE